MRVHVSLNVASLENSETFYTGLFGTGPSKRRAGYANFRLEAPPIHLALVENGKVGAGGVSHLGIELPDPGTLEDWKQRLFAAGLEPQVEDRATCCYAIADKLWLTDPDGYRWEVWVRTGEYGEMGATRVAV